MNELFEEVRDWLSKSLAGKILGFILLVYTINTIVWGFIEPISASYELFCHYAICHYLFVITLSGICLYRILRRKIIKTVNFETLEINGKDIWITQEGTPIRFIDSDGILGKYISFKGGFDDQSKFNFDGVSSTGSVLSITYNPKEHFMIYAHFKLNSKVGSSVQEGWLALHYNIKTPFKETNFEWGYPIKIRVIENSWLSSIVDIKSAIKKTFGKSGWEYGSLIGVKIRGTGALHEISVS